MVTIAVNEPAVVGSVDRVTVRDVAVALVTEPTAPLLNTTVLFAAVVSKPIPLMISVLALAFRLFELLMVTTGITSAIWTAAPLD